MTEFLLQAASLVGAVLILGAFAALQRGYTRSTGRWYLWANFIGSVLLAVVAVVDRRMGFILLESIWAIVTLWSIVRPARPPAPA